MKKIFHSTLLLIALSAIFISCGKDYTTSSSGSGGVNPLDPLTISQFTWSGTGPLSATINGVSFVSDSTYTSWSFDTLGNVIVGLNATSTRGISLVLGNVYAGNIYNMGFNSSVYGVWVDSVGVPNDYYYSTLGNSGEVYIIENDSAYIKGKFYFTGVSQNGNPVIVSNGYFDIKKPS